MKTKLWAVVLLPNVKMLAGANLDRLIADANYRVNNDERIYPIVILSIHSSPHAADKAAVMIGKKFRPLGWFVAESCARHQANQECF